MSRGIGEFELLQEQIPEWLAVGIALLTQLGDIWFLALLLLALYWGHTTKRDQIAMVAGIWMAGMGLYKGLKEMFGFPRPDRPLLEADVLPGIVQPLYEATAFATGYGFPSGHAVNATIVYVGLAYILGFSTPRKRFAGAAAVVATVSVTRVALGVHYLVDVIVGVVVGAVLLLVALRLVTRVPTDRVSVTFGLAIVFGVFFLIASGAHPDALLVLAVSLGAFAGWQLRMLGRELALLTDSGSALQPVLVRGGATVATIAPLVAALEGFSIASAVTISGVARLLAAGIVAIPAVHHSGRLYTRVARLRNWL